jgi:hypothetical protein
MSLRTENNLILSLNIRPIQNIQLLNALPVIIWQFRVLQHPQNVLLAQAGLQDQINATG